jgi:CheY-like chemotaxis protein
MMRILWVEDNERVVENQQHLFGDFLTDHDLKLISNFSQADSDISDKLYRYDLIVLDINLEISSVDERVTKLANKFGLSNQTFLEEAGFHLYLKLLKQGFPQTRVIFLTANVDTNPVLERIQNFKRVVKESTDDEELQQALNELAPFMSDDKHNEFQEILDTNETNETMERAFQWLDEWGGQLNIEGEKTIKNTYEIFKYRFKEARLIPPEAFDKKQEGSLQKLQEWLWSHGKRNLDNCMIYDYITLRRGILNVITEIKENSTIQLNPTFQELDKTTFLEGLIFHLRDFSLPKTKHSQLYSSLCEYLTKPFQEAYDGTKLRQEENVENRHLKLPLYNLRNWIVHGLLVGSNTRLSAQEVCITFLLAMKGLFNRERYAPYEELERLLNTSQVPQERLTAIIWRLLHRSSYYGAARQQYHIQQQNPLSLIHHKTKKSHNLNWKQENYIRHFYATYLFSIHCDATHLLAIEHLENQDLEDTIFNNIIFNQIQKHL